MFGGKVFGGANIFAKLDFSDVKLVCESKKEGKCMILSFAKGKRIKFTV